MVDYNIVIVPPGGGEVDFTQKIRGATHVPRIGEYIVISVDGGDDAHLQGVEAYQVRYAVSHLSRKGWGETSFVYSTLEVEPVRHAYQSPSHAEVCKMYDGHWGHPTKDFPESGY
jgi:hypothetical protein